jgi:DNA-binding SARP family transcriptional activator
MAGSRQRALADANRADVAARQRRDNPGLAEAITLRVLAAGNPAVDTTPLRDAIDIWQETGCRLEEAATRLVAARLGTSIPHLDAYRAEHMLREHGVDVESRRAAGPLGVLVRSAPAVSIQTLGGFGIIRGGVMVPITEWKSKKARDLLKILIAHRRPISRDRLMELLWPETDPALSSNRLSVLLSMVRDVLRLHPAAEDPLVTTDGVLSLNPVRVRVDVEDFLSQAAAALAANRSEEPDATERLTVAVATHTGGFLVDDPYEEWAVELAEEVRATHIALLRALATRMRDAGDTDAVVRYTLCLLQQDRYDEEAHLALAEVLFDAGRFGQARSHYKTYVHRMSEIGVAPRALPNMKSRGLAAG